MQTVGSSAGSKGKSSDHTVIDMSSASEAVLLYDDIFNNKKTIGTRSCRRRPLIGRAESSECHIVISCPVGGEGVVFIQRARSNGGGYW